MHPFNHMPRVATVMVVAQGASVCYVFAIVWPTMVFFLQTSDLIKEGHLCCFAGCETKTGQIIDRNLCRRLGKQKTKIVVISICMGTFLTGKLSFSHERYRSICRIDCLAYAYATPCNQKSILAFIFLGCFAMGWMEVVGLAITGIAIDSQVEIGTAVGVVGSMRSTVSTIASTIYTAILTTRLKKAIPQKAPSNLIAAVFLHLLLRFVCHHSWDT